MGKDWHQRMWLEGKREEEEARKEKID